MSYVVGIVRQDQHGGPITPTEIERLIAEDGSLEYDRRGGIIWKGHSSGEPIEFIFEKGRIDSMTTPDDETMNQMEKCAHRLGADIEGEDGATSGVSWPRPDPFFLILLLLVILGFVGILLIWMVKEVLP